MIDETKELVAGQNRDRGHWRGKWSVTVERKPKVVGPGRDLTGHRSGAYWLFRKKIGDLAFIGFKIVKLRLRCHQD